MTTGGDHAILACVVLAAACVVAAVLFAPKVTYRLGGDEVEATVRQGAEAQLNYSLSKEYSGMALDHLPDFIRTHYEVHEWKHATAILYNDFPVEWQDIIAVLTSFRLRRSEIESPGGRKSPITEALDSAFYARGWVEKSFQTEVVVDQRVMNSPTHEVDCYKNQVALEVEWNNKDPFFDRDLNNFRLLFDLRAISVGVIITRSDDLQRIFNSLGKGSSYGASTTHMSKLLPRIEGGSGGGCPILVFGITDKVYVEGA